MSPSPTSRALAPPPGPPDAGAATGPAQCHLETDAPDERSRWWFRAVVAGGLAAAGTFTATGTGTGSAGGEQWAEVVCAALALLVGGWPFLAAVGRGLRTGRPEADALVGVAAVLAVGRAVAGVAASSHAGHEHGSSSGWASGWLAGSVHPGRFATFGAAVVVAHALRHACAPRRPEPAADPGDQAAATGLLVWLVLLVGAGSAAGFALVHAPGRGIEVAVAVLAAVVVPAATPAAAVPTPAPAPAPAAALPPAAAALASALVFGYDLAAVAAVTSGRVPVYVAPAAALAVSLLATVVDRRTRLRHASRRTVVAVVVGSAASFAALTLAPGALPRPAPSFEARLPLTDGRTLLVDVPRARPGRAETHLYLLGPSGALVGIDRLDVSGYLIQDARLPKVALVPEVGVTGFGHYGGWITFAAGYWYVQVSGRDADGRPFTTGFNVDLTDRNARAPGPSAAGPSAGPTWTT